MKTKSELQQLKNKDLVNLYNDTADKLDRPHINRFKNKASAVERTYNILQLAEPKKKGKKPKAGNHLKKGKSKPKFNSGTTGIIVKALEVGPKTFEQIQRIVEREREKSGKSYSTDLRKRTQYFIRHINQTRRKLVLNTGKYHIV